MTSITDEKRVTLSKERRPYCCPVCYGVGHVAAGFYARVSVPEQCRSCGGTGIVWGEDASEPEGSAHA
jgi:DnaJ-class molecular chaperone